MSVLVVLLAGCRSARLISEDDPASSLVSASGARAPLLKDALWSRVDALRPVVFGNDSDAGGDDAGGGADDIARKLQNPLANIKAIMSDNDIFFDTGDDATSVQFQIQPVYAIDFGRFSLINRAVFPIIGAADMSDLPWWIQPESAGGESTTWGLGDTATQFFVAPKVCGKWKFGGGPQFTWRTRTDEKLVGPGNGAGIVGIVTGPITDDLAFSAIVGNTWSYDGAFHSFLFHPMLYYNISAIPGAYVAYNNAWTADWKGTSDNRWTIPLGLTAGRTIPLGKCGHAIDLSLGSYYFVESPDGGPAWSIKFGVTFVLP